MRRQLIFKVTAPTLVAIAAAGMLLAAYHLHAQMRIVNQVESLGGRIALEQEYCKKGGQSYRAALHLMTVTDYGREDSWIPQCCRKLTIVDLRRTQTTDADLAVFGKLKGVRYLDLSETQITHQSFRQIAAMNDLRELDISGNNLSSASIEKLLAERSDLTIYRHGRVGNRRPLYDAMRQRELSLQARKNTVR